MMKRSCAIYLVIFAVIFAIYYGLIRTQTSTPFGPDLGLSLLCSAFTVFFISAIYGLWRGREDSAAIQRAEKGIPLKDGRLEAAVGKIYPVGEPLTSPFQQAACVAYSYAITHPEIRTTVTGSGADRQEKRETVFVSDYSGYQYAPAVIKTNRGDIRLFGMASLDYFDKELSRTRAAANARAYLDNTPLEDIDGLSAIPKAFEIASSSSDTLRGDFRLGGAELGPEQLFDEQVVTVGQNVTALGYYSAAQGSFAPHLTGTITAGMVNRIFPGNGKTAQKNLKRQEITNLIFSGIGFLFMHIFLILAILRS